MNKGRKNKLHPKFQHQLNNTKAEQYQERLVKETDIQNAILEYLQYKNIFVWRNNNTPVFDPRTNAYRRMPKGSIKGVSDILGVFKGKMLAIEVKRPGFYPSQSQKKFLQQINDEGGVGFIARSVDDVERELYGE